MIIRVNAQDSILYRIMLEIKHYWLDSRTGDMKVLRYTVNIYRYKAIGANATSSVISTTVVCIKVRTASFPRFWKNHP